MSNLPAGKAGNKITTYMLYAIGEIVLVVVGILIAVSIDDAQENRKKEELKQNYTIALIENLKEDSVYLTSQINYFTDFLSDLSALKTRLENSETTLDTIYTIARYEYRPSFLQQNEIAVDIIDALISTGNLNLYNQTIVQQFLQLKKVQRTSFEIIDNQAEAYGDLFMQYESKYSAGGSSWTVVKGKLDDITWESIDKVALAKDFRALFTYQIALMRSMIREKQKVLDQTTELISYLNN